MVNRLQFLRIVFLLITNAWACSALALSPIRLAGEVTLRFEIGAVAVSSAQREQLGTELDRVLSRKPCNVQIGANAYGDVGLPFQRMRLLAFERAQYIRGVIARLRPDAPAPALGVGGERPEEVALLGTAKVIVSGYIGELGCGK